MTMFHANMLNKFLPHRPRAKRALPDDVIDNNGAPDAIASDVARLHAQYLTFAAQAVAQEKP